MRSKISSRPARRGPYQRFTASEKQAYLSALARHGGSIRQFCETQGLSLSSVSLWRRQARTSQQRRRPGNTKPPTFARVDVQEVHELRPAQAAALQHATSPVLLTVRTPAGEAELTGLDALTAGQIAVQVVERFLSTGVVGMARPRQR